MRRDVELNKPPNASLQHALAEQMETGSTYLLIFWQNVQDVVVHLRDQLIDVVLRGDTVVLFVDADKETLRIFCPVHFGLDSTEHVQQTEFVRVWRAVN